jgi:hypothetical protein
MTSYVAIASGEIDADSPITADLMSKLRDNPIAISEGSAGAPKVMAAALNLTANTLTGSIGSSTTTAFSLSQYSLFPSISVSSNGIAGISNTGTSTVPKVYIQNPNSSGSLTYSIWWSSIA